MEIILLNFNFFIFFIYFYKKIRHGLHILQLENYYDSRYLTWIKNNFKKVFKIKEIILLAILVVISFLNSKLGLVLNTFTYIILSLLFRKRKEKKAFVVTSRIKRMYITFLIIFAIIVYIANSISTEFAILIMNISIILGYLFVLIIDIINKPIEKIIKLKYTINSKNKLKENDELKVVGITGSFGKTSTKHIVEAVLSKKYHTLMTPESYNTPMGVVRTINEKLLPTHNLFVCEMGAKYIGDIKEICDIVKPDYGIITAIGPQHLDTFKSLENVAKTKLELIDSLPEESGIAFVNWEDENIRSQKIDKKCVKFGLSKEADYYAENIEITEKGSMFTVVLPNKEKILVRTKLLGKLNVLNIVGAVAIADKLGLNAEQIKAGVKLIKPVKHRLELKQNANGSIIIDDAYNSNIKGAKMAIDVLAEFKTKKKILITPGIVELGDKQYEINKELGEYAVKADYIILVGEKQTKPIHDGLMEKKYPKEKIYIAKTLEDALAQMNQIVDNNSVILLENDLPDNYL